jgi:hypothetical protein
MARGRLRAIAGGRGDGGFYRPRILGSKASNLNTRSWHTLLYMSRMCPHCKVKSHFTHRWSQTTQLPLVEDSSEPEVLIFCETCDNCWLPVCGAVLVEEGDLNDAMVWPARVDEREYPDVPKEIASVANEAHLALGANAPRAAVVMARATVELTAKGHGISSGTLETKIDKLAAEEHISEQMKFAAHEIRFAGNEVAHADMTAEHISLGDAAEIVDLMDAILKRAYQEPAQVARIRESREARKKG